MTSEILAKIVAGLLNLYPVITAYMSPDSISAQMQIMGGFTINVLFFAMVLLACCILLEVLAKTPLSQSAAGCWLIHHLGAVHLGIAFLAVVVPFSVSRDNDLSMGAMFIYGLILFVNLCRVYILAQENENTREADHV